MRSLSALRPRLAVKAVLVQQRFTASQVPSEDEVRSAYAALGVSTSSPFQEVKKRYVELAKQHHPDVNGASASGDRTGDTAKRMVDINNAYATLNQFHKAGGVLSSGRYGGNSQAGNSRGNGSSSSSGGGGSHAYYTSSDEPYQPWHEDLNPLIYEMMWDEMRRQGEHEEFVRAAAQESRRRQGPNARPQDSGGQHSKGAKRQKKSGAARETPKQTTTWPKEDLQAMVNMYQDGKSFDFIANALGKKTPDVVAEFNRWSESNKRTSRPSQRRHMHPSNRSYYYAESPDGEFVNFGDYDDQFGYIVDDGIEYGDSDVDPEDVFFDGGAIPFTGAHCMSGHCPRRGGGGGGPYGRGRHGRGGGGGPRKW